MDFGPDRDPREIGQASAWKMTHRRTAEASAKAGTQRRTAAASANAGTQGEPPRSFGSRRGSG